MYRLCRCTGSTAHAVFLNARSRSSALAAVILHRSKYEERLRE
jgi:hypothetical protein